MKRKNNAVSARSISDKSRRTAREGIVPPGESADEEMRRRRVL
jgi:hypothetical protein